MPSRNPKQQPRGILESLEISVKSWIIHVFLITAFATELLKGLVTNFGMVVIKKQEKKSLAMLESDMI